MCALSGALWLALAGFAQAQVLSGGYTGNGTADRAIAELGFSPDVVIVKGNSSQVAVIRTSTMSGDAPDEPRRDG